MTKQQKKIDNLVLRCKQYKYLKRNVSIKNCMMTIHCYNREQNYTTRRINMCIQNCLQDSDEMGFEIMNKLKGMSKRKRKLVLSLI